MNNADVEKLIQSAGGITALARVMNSPVTTVSAWKYRGRIPAERVIDVESVTGIPRYKIRPDIYPPKDFLDAALFEQGGQ